MRWTRRRALAVGTAVISGSLAGCTGWQREDNGESEYDHGWPWDGDVPVESVTQHHEPSCDCCGEYVEYLERNGFEVDVEAVADTDALNAKKTDLGVPESMWSCHTVEFGDYLVEGHVPLEAVERLFDIDASVLGVSIPGMPFHAPGMGRPGPDPLTIYAFGSDGDAIEFVEIE